MVELQNALTVESLELTRLLKLGVRGQGIKSNAHIAGMNIGLLSTREITELLQRVHVIAILRGREYQQHLARSHERLPVLLNILTKGQVPQVLIRQTDSLRPGTILVKRG